MIFLVLAHVVKNGWLAKKSPLHIHTKYTTPINNHTKYTTPINNQHPQPFAICLRLLTKTKVMPINHLIRNLGTTSGNRTMSIDTQKRLVEQRQCTKMGSHIPQETHTTHEHNPKSVIRHLMYAITENMVGYILESENIRYIYYIYLTREYSLTVVVVVDHVSLARALLLCQ